MKLVYSLWTKPYLDKQDPLGFNTLQDFFNSFILSVNTSRRFFSKTVFYTDKFGIELLEPIMDDLNFDEVIVNLDEMNWAPSHWWAYPKMYVYSLQDEPFLHIDNDAYFWEPLPEWIHGEYDFICQSLEPIDNDFYYFYNDGLDWYQNHIPVSLAEASWKHPWAANAGVFGAINEKGLDIFQKLWKEAKKSADLVLNDKEFMATMDWTDLREWNCFLLNIIMEQAYTFTLCQENNTRLFRLLDDCNTKFTHLISGAKRDKKHMIKIAERVKNKDWNHR